MSKIILQKKIKSKRKQRTHDLRFQRWILDVYTFLKSEKIEGTKFERRYFK